jgi:1,2-diacylglycerol 3-beta-glucosyltransferase
VARRILLALQAPLALSTLYLLVLLVAARGARRRARDELRDGGGERRRLVVLVPAHDEEVGIEATIGALRECEYPERARRIVVVADNCSDGTAASATAAGAEVWERADPQRRGKGFALAWALERLLAEEDPFAAVVFVDADCLASPNLMAAIDERLAEEVRAMQVDYVAANPGDSSTAALRFAAFAVGDTVRFLGKERLGLSCGLVGTGMAFARDVLERNPWTTTGLVEDGEFHMQLVLAGERVEFVAEAQVSQAVPISLQASASQQERWEMGKAQLIRRWSARLLLSGLARRDVGRFHAGLECLVPPQSVIASGSSFSLGAALLLRSRRLLGLALLTVLAQATFVLGGLRLVGAPSFVYRALLAAPALALSKIALYARLIGGAGPTAWVRTERQTPLGEGVA